MSDTNRYRFDAVFDYNPSTGTTIPRYTVLINGVKFNQDTPIVKSASFGGLTLPNYIDRDIAGTWDASTKILTILGFY